MTSAISIIIPALNEAEGIADAVASARGPGTAEVIVVDGGSTDATEERARAAGARVIVSAPGRGRQMNTGARRARGEILLFLHGDSRLPAGFSSQVEAVLSRPRTVAGAFRLAIDLPGLGAAWVAAGANLRSRLGLPYGDQALFMPRRVFFEAGGYDEVPILEDVFLVRKLRRLGRLRLAPGAVLTSGRRWQRLGVVRTTLVNQKVMIAWLLGVPLEELRAWYGGRSGVGKNR